MRKKIFIYVIVPWLAACKPAVEKIYEQSFNLRAARELDSTGDTTGARYYLKLANTEANARAEAESFIQRISERQVKAGRCIDDKKTDLEINQYPRIRHKHFFQLAVCLESSGDTDKALKAYMLSENAGSAQPQLYIRRALLEERLGDKKAAAKDFARAVQLNAEYPPALLNQALFMVRTGRADEADKIAVLLEAKKPFYAEIIRDALKKRHEFAGAWGYK